MSLSVQRTSTQEGSKMEVANANGCISNSCETLQNDRRIDVKYEMQNALLKVMTKIFSAKVVVVRLPDIDVLKKETDDEKSNSELNESIDDKTLALKVQYSKDTIADLFTKSCLCNVKLEGELLTSNQCRDCNSRFTFECKKCNKKLTSYIGMQRHILTKCNFQGYYNLCPDCPFKSAFIYDVLHHVRKLHPNRQTDEIKRITDQDFQANVKYLYKCTKCGEAYIYKTTLLNHICTHSSAIEEIAFDKTNENDSTIAKYSPLNEIPDRLLIRNMASRYCLDCDEEHVYRTSERQMCPHCDANMLFKCSKCNQTCKSGPDMISHLRTKCASQKNFKCSKCEYINSQRGLVLVHYKNIHGAMRFECPQCGVKLKSKYSLNLHLNNCNKKPNLCCTIKNCSFKTNNLKSLTTHTSRHLRAENASCPKCHKRFKSTLIKNSHVSTCGIKSRFFCDNCPYATRQKRYLQTHMLRTHRQEMNNDIAAVCPKCDVVFKNQRDNKGHLRLCKTSKPRLECNYCYYMIEKEKELLFIQHMKNAHPGIVENKSRRRIENDQETK